MRLYRLGIDLLVWYCLFLILLPKPSHVRSVPMVWYFLIFHFITTRDNNCLRTQARNICRRSWLTKFKPKIPQTVHSGMVAKFKYTYFQIHLEAHVENTCITASFHQEEMLAFMRFVRPRHFLSKCPYQTRKVSCQVYACQRLRQYFCLVNFGAVPKLWYFLLIIKFWIKTINLSVNVHSYVISLT